MIFLAGMGHLLNGIVIISLTILLLAVLLKRLKQPYFIAYILAGVLLGPEGFAVISDRESIMQLGELGIVLLMFFIGAEIRLPDLQKQFIKPVVATLSQLVLSFAFIFLLGMRLAWSWHLVVLMSFIVSLSSSAIIFQYLSKSGEINTRLGLLTSGVLLVQDMLVVPMLLTISFMVEGSVEVADIVRMLLGAILILAFLWAAVRQRLFRIPFHREIEKDHDLQVFVGFLVCFGFAWVSQWFGLSAALGAFVAGILIAQDDSTRWLDRAMVPFRVFFLTFFFLAIGLQLDLHFLSDNILLVMLIVLFVMLSNSLINALIFRFLGSSWRNSIYAGALLSQIGEFSFVLAATAFAGGIIGDFIYQLTLSVISLTMVFTVLWISIIRQAIYPGHGKRDLT